MLNALCLVDKKGFLFNLVLKFWFVRFIEVKFHLGAQLSIHFTQVSALWCTLYRGDSMRIWPENGRGHIFVRFTQVPALEHAGFRQVLLY